MSKETPKIKWIKVTKHNGEQHINPWTAHKKNFLEKQNNLLPVEKKMKIEEVLLTEEEARKIEPINKDHVPPTQDEVKVFIEEIDAKDKEIAELKKQLAAAVKK